MSAAEFLRHVDSWLFDLDGCIWIGNALTPEAADLVADLRAQGCRVGFLTNTSWTDAAGTAAKLDRLGVPATARDVVTPLSVLLEAEAFRRAPRVLVLATDAVARLLIEAGIEVVADAHEADLVLVGKDEELVYADLAEATEALVCGADLVALNLDPSVPGAGGRTVPGVGAIVAALTTASGVEPELVGKPSRAFFEHALVHFGMAARRTVMVGDRADVDVRGGNAAGLHTILVGAGTTAGEGADAPSARFADLGGLRDAIAAR